MAETTTAEPGSEAAEHDDHHPTPKLYVQVALVLSVLTALEFSTYYIDFGPVFIPLLLVLMAIKFFIIARMFMHLKFDNAVFSRLMYTGLVLALALFGIAIASLAEVPLL